MARLEVLTGGAAVQGLLDEISLAGVPRSRGAQDQGHIHRGGEPTVARAGDARKARAGERRR
jgi:hypothetical protein